MEVGGTEADNEVWSWSWCSFGPCGARFLRALVQNSNSPIPTDVSRLEIEVALKCVTAALLCGCVESKGGRAVVCTYISGGFYRYWRRYYGFRDMRS